MAVFTFIGDVDEIDVYGVHFVRGEATEVPDDHPQLAKFAGNGQFVSGEGDGLEAFTLAKLKAHAEANGIDLGDAKKKADILVAIRAAA